MSQTRGSFPELYTNYRKPKGIKPLPLPLPMRRAAKLKPLPIPKPKRGR
jgi:hypothetical protein